MANFFEIYGLKKPKKARLSIAFLSLHSIKRKLERNALKVHDSHVGLMRLLVAPNWDVGVPFVSNALFKAVQFWLVVVPIVVGLVSAFPIHFLAPGFEISIGENFNSPLSFKISFVSAFLIFSGILIFRMACPEVVKYGYTDPTGPVSTVEEMSKLYREIMLEGLPRRISMNGDSIRRPVGSYYRSGDFKSIPPDGPPEAVSEYKFLPILGKLACELLTQDQLMTINRKNLSVNPSREMFMGDTFFEGDKKARNPGSLINKYLNERGSELKTVSSKSIDEIIDSGELYKGSYFLYNLLLMDVSADKEEYPYLYRIAARSRILSRSLFWIIYGLGALMGAYVVLDMILRGFRTMF